jgi:hypothetical protein
MRPRDPDREFRALAWAFARLVTRFALPMPIFGSVAGANDTTSPGEVCFGRGGDVEMFGHRVRHLFGHWLADLHAGEPARSDDVADVIAWLLDASSFRAYRMEGAHGAS